MARSDASIRASWRARLVTRLALERAAKAQHTLAQKALQHSRATGQHPRQALVDARDGAADKLATRRKQVADARAVIARHSPKRSRVAFPVAGRVYSMANDWHPGHDGVDIICEPRAKLLAICDARVVDVRSGGWWGKGANGNVAAGDGIIQLESLVNVGPFRKGQHFGYGHAEGATVKVGQTVLAGDGIGRSGFANAWHPHFMVNDGQTTKGIGTRDPKPFLTFAKEHQS